MLMGFKIQTESLEFSVRSGLLIMYRLKCSAGSFKMVLEQHLGHVAVATYIFYIPFISPSKKLFTGAVL